MAVGAEEKFQKGGEIANMLLDGYGVITHAGLHIDEVTGRLTIQVIRVNVLNPSIDTDEQEVVKKLHRTGIENYSNLVVYYNQYTPDEVVQINFLVDFETELKCCTTAVISL